MIDFAPYRKADGSFDLETAYLMNFTTPQTSEQGMEIAVKFLKKAESIRPIRSRQVMAIAMAIAVTMCGCTTLQTAAKAPPKTALWCEQAVCKEVPNPQYAIWEQNINSAAEGSSLILIGMH